MSSLTKLSQPTLFCIFFIFLYWELTINIQQKISIMIIHKYKNTNYTNTTKQTPSMNISSIFVFCCINTCYHIYPNNFPYISESIYYSSLLWLSAGYYDFLKLWLPSLHIINQDYKNKDIPMTIRIKCDLILINHVSPVLQHLIKNGETWITVPNIEISLGGVIKYKEQHE